MAPQELDKVLSIKLYAEVTKRNGYNNEPQSLTIKPDVFLIGTANFRLIV